MDFYEFMAELHRVVFYTVIPSRLKLENMLSEEAKAAAALKTEIIRRNSSEALYVFAGLALMFVGLAIQVVAGAMFLWVEIWLD